VIVVASCATLDACATCPGSTTGTLPGVLTSSEAGPSSITFSASTSACRSYAPGATFEMSTH
jgi:hypothetical protein